MFGFLKKAKAKKAAEKDAVMALLGVDEMGFSRLTGNAESGDQDSNLRLGGAYLEAGVTSKAAHYLGQAYSADREAALPLLRKLYIAESGLTEEELTEDKVAFDLEFSRWIKNIIVGDWSVDDD